MNLQSYILIVEDSETQARQLESILKPIGYGISIAYTAKDALDFLKRQKPVLVIADILMPEMDGYQLCKMIKGDDRLRDIPVVLLTQLSDPREVIKGLESSADDFISKPYNEELLLTRISTILNIKKREDIINKKLNILVVEDSPTQAEQLRYMLEEQGYGVVTAGNGREGLEAARRIKPTLIIADILMPVMDGYEMASEIRRDESLKKTPIILITSLQDKKDIVRKASVIADGFFTKPYDEQYLQSKIKLLISNINHEDKGNGLTELDVTFAGEHYNIISNRRQILTFLLSTYENAVQQNHDLIMMQRELQIINEQLEKRVKERTEELQASEGNFRSLADNANDSIMIVTDKGKFVYVNRRLLDMTGYSVEELLKMNIFDLIHPNFCEAARERFGERIDGTVPIGHSEIAIVKKNRNSLLAEATCSRTFWHGQPAVIGLLRDISERKRRVDEFVKLEKLESLGILAGGIAHDFNNFLTGILGNISLAKKKCKPDDIIYKLLSDSEKASQGAKSLTYQLLTFAKGGTPARKTISIIKLLRDDVEFACRGSNVKCSLNIPDDLWPVNIDEGQINQVIYNIVINAGHAMSEGGTVELSAENINAYADNRYFVKEGKYVKIAISDTGSGISEENLNKIFDPYFTTKKTGSGLGLASAYSIIKNHDGYISVELKVGKGTTFYIYLPKSQSEAAVIKEHEEGLVYGEGKILVMDDEEILSTAAGMILDELGYSADFARDGKEAIKLYKKAKDSGEPFNAVLMDLTIPAGMGGKEAVKELIKIDPDVRVIVCSGYSNDPIMSEYADYGFSAAIVKPYNIDELSRTINEVVKGKGSE